MASDEDHAHAEYIGGTGAAGCGQRQGEVVLSDELLWAWAPAPYGGSKAPSDPPGMLIAHLFLLHRVTAQACHQQRGATLTAFAIKLINPAGTFVSSVLRDYQSTKLFIFEGKCENRSAIGRKSTLAPRCRCTHWLKIIFQNVQKF
jgi:hypothetical protein